MSHRVTHQVGAEEEGQTLAALVRTAMGDLPWSRARRLCTAGQVWVGEERCLDPARRMQPGEAIHVDQGAPRRKRGTLSRDAIAYVDRDVVVVRKPAGVLTVPYARDDKDTLVDQTHAALRPRQKASLGVVHRLDKDTSGLLVFARTLAAKRHLQQQFRAHSTERRYLAIVQGAARPATHDTRLVANRGDGLRGSWGVSRPPVGKLPRDARRAVTHVEVLERLHGATLVLCRLETGRQHQIRIHLSEAGTPIVGERVYIRELREPAIEAPRPMLHATHLAFEHPRTGEVIALDEPPPEDFEATLARLRNGAG